MTTGGALGTGEDETSPSTFMERNWTGATKTGVGGERALVGARKRAPVAHSKGLASAAT